MCVREGAKLHKVMMYIRFVPKRECPTIVSIVIENNNLISIARNNQNMGCPHTTM